MRGEKIVNSEIITSGGDPSAFSVTPDLIFSLIFVDFLIPIAILTVLFAIDFIGNKAQHWVHTAIAITLTMCVAAGILLYSPISGSITASYFVLAFVMTAVVFILHFIKLSAVDYATLFACFICISRFVGLHPSWFGGSLTILYVFIILLTVSKIRLKHLNGYLFYVWFASIFTSLEGYVFEVLFSKYVRHIGYSFHSPLEKLIVWALASFAIICLNLALIYAIKLLFQKYFDQINQMGTAYPRIERFFIYICFGILLLMTLLQFGYVLSHRFNNSLSEVFTLFALFALVIQLSFLIMIFRITWLKDSLQSKTLENKSLAAYSSNLEQNINDIKNIKHDIKNIFLTMGNFVEQSDNTEMQAFYREKISPFANEEIAKSDLYGKLVNINNEHLKAFLFYKISQAIERDIAFDLDISSRFSASGISIEFTDLVRILGILLDNAIEECIELTYGLIVIKISQNNELVSYMVKNTVRPEKKEKGIKAGVSSKGAERGNGLMIARGILKKYDYVTLNSYFSDDCFVQNLVIYQTD